MSEVYIRKYGSRIENRVSEIQRYYLIDQLDWNRIGIIFVQNNGKKGNKYEGYFGYENQ